MCLPHTPHQKDNGNDQPRVRVEDGNKKSENDYPWVRVEEGPRYTHHGHKPTSKQEQDLGTCPPTHKDCRGRRGDDSVHFCRHVVLARLTCDFVDASLSTVVGAVDTATPFTNPMRRGDPAQFARFHRLLLWVWGRRLW